MNFFAVIPSAAKRSRGTPPKNPVVTRRGPSRPSHKATAWQATSLGMTSRRTLATLLCLIFGIASLAFAQADPDFAKANQEYAQGHFKEAISGYEALVRSGQWNANLFYDLGNAYFRTGDFGRSILNYERALALDRHHPEAMANLQIARDESRALELQPSRLDRYLQFGSTNQYSVAAAVAFWLGIFGLVMLIFARRRSAALTALSIACLLVCAVAVGQFTH